MNFLENLVSGGINSMAPSNPLATSLLQFINQQPGGVAGLVQNFHEKGLGELASSWVGNGQNLPITAQQIQQVLGSQQVQEMAAKAGISPETVTAHLSSMLPALVDKLTPNGQIPDHASLLETGMSLLKSFENPAA